MIHCYVVGCVMFDSLVMVWIDCVVCCFEGVFMLVRVLIVLS